MNKDFNDEFDRSQGSKGRSRARNAGQENQGYDNSHRESPGQNPDSGRQPRRVDPIPRSTPVRRERPASMDGGQGQRPADGSGGQGQRPADGSTRQGQRPADASARQEQRPTDSSIRQERKNTADPGMRRERPASMDGESRQEYSFYSRGPVNPDSEGFGEPPARRKTARQEEDIRSAKTGRQTRQDGPQRTSSQNQNASASRSAIKNAKAKKRKRIIILAIAEIITLALIMGCGYVSRTLNLMQRPVIDKDKLVNPDLSVEQQQHMKGYWTIAVFGVDSRDGNVGAGTNTDVIMICNINQDTGDVRLVSVYRDTYLNTSSSKSTYAKINSAYANGGPEQAIAAINRNLDLNITEYVTFNWKAVALGINLLGGVDIEITKPEFNYINSFITETVKKTGIGSNHLKKAGMNHLDGIQAVAYGRLRLMDTDFQRTERQRLVIQKAFEKAKVADISQLNQIVMNVFPLVGTNLELNDLLNLAVGISKYKIGETSGFPTTHGEMIMGKKGDCVIPQTLESNVKELHKFLFGKDDYVPSDTVKRISAKIAADSGMYKNGGGSGTKSTESSETKKETKETTEESSSIHPGETDESIFETDEDGNIITRPTKPGETKPGETKPGETKPGESKPGESKPGETKPGETKPGETKPGETKPGETKPNESKPVHPSESAPSTEGGNGPGTAPTSPVNPTSPTETTASQGPGSGTSSPGDNLGPGGSGDNLKPTSDVPIVSPPGA